MAQTQKRRQNGRQAELAWLITDQDQNGRVWFSVRLFITDCGPIYFGPFQDTRQADTFYAQSQRCLDEAACDLINLVSAGRI